MFVSLTRDRAARVLERAGEHLLGDVRHRVGLVLLLLVAVVLGAGVGRRLLLGLAFLELLALEGDAVADGGLGSGLGDAGDIGAREALGLVGQPLVVDLGVDRRLAQRRLEDADARVEVGQTDVDQRVQTARTHQSGVDDIL